MIYYISDLHFFDGGKTLRECRRPFNSQAEYQEHMVEAWNETVEKEDTVCIVGDFCCANADGIRPLIESLNGDKRLIRGNHEKHWLLPEYATLFVSIDDMLIIQDEGRIVHLCHYPLISWYKSEYGSYCVFGHIHNEFKEEYAALEKLRAFNASVDVNGFRPRTLDEMIDLKQKQYENALQTNYDGMPVRQGRLVESAILIPSFKV